MAEPKKKRGSSGRKDEKKKGGKKRRAKTPPEPPPEPWEPPPHCVPRYTRIEVDLIRAGLEVNHAQVLTDAWQRWELQPGPGAVPPPPPPKEPERAQAELMAEHRRRLGQARDFPPSRVTPEADQASANDRKKGEEAKEKEAVTVVESEKPEEDKGRKTVAADPMDPCRQLKEPCRRIFKGTCFPCPVHTPGVPRDPKKKCTCKLTSRPETRRDALNFLIGLPAELSATYSSLDPARLEEERQRKKSEERWRRRLEAQQQRFDKAMRRARALVEAQVMVTRPPFVTEHNELTAHAYGLPTVRLNLVF